MLSWNWHQMKKWDSIGALWIMLFSSFELIFFSPDLMNSELSLCPPRTLSPLDSSSHWSLSPQLCPLPSFILLTGSLRLQNNLNVICSRFRNPLLFPGTKGCKVHFLIKHARFSGTGRQPVFPTLLPTALPHTAHEWAEWKSTDLMAPIPRTEELRSLASQRVRHKGSGLACLAA